MTANKAKDWQTRAVLATHGNQSQFGAIFLATIPDQELRRALRARARCNEYPAFASCATVTSDGYILSSFIDRNGEGHASAFVGAYVDFKRNVLGLAAHLKLTGKDREDYLRQMRAWITADYRFSNVETF